MTHGFGDNLRFFSPHHFKDQSAFQIGVMTFFLYCVFPIWRSKLQLSASCPKAFWKMQADQYKTTCMRQFASSAKTEHIHTKTPGMPQRIIRRTS